MCVTEMKTSVASIKKSASLVVSDKEWPQILAIVSGALSAFNAGTFFTWTSPAIPKLLESDYDIDLEAASYLSVFPPVAMILASPIYCKLIDKIGRKKTLLTSAALHIGAWLLIGFAKNIYVFYASRILSGICDACVFASLPVYIGEVATPKVRRLWANSMSLFMCCGQFFINIVGYYCTVSTTAFVMLVCPVTFFVTFVFMPETPYYFVMKHDQEAARSSLRKLRRKDDVDEELQQITVDLQRQLSESGTFKDLFLIASNRRAVLTAVLIRTSQQLSGIGALMVYTQYVFMQAGGEISSGVAAMIFTGVLAIANPLGNIISDKLGRNRSMVISSSGCGAALLSLSAFFYLETYTNVDTAAVSWFPVFALFAYISIFVVGLCIVPTMLLGELFSASIKSQATIVTSVSFAVILCIVPKLFQFLMSSFGLFAPFMFFSVCCFLGAIISYYFVPDTKGKTLEEIQQDLKGNK